MSRRSQLVARDAFSKIFGLPATQIPLQILNCWVEGRISGEPQMQINHMAGCPTSLAPEGRGEIAARGTWRVHGNERRNNSFQINKKEWWRRGESNPRPKSATPRSLHAYLSSVWFASRAQNEQETHPASPMNLAAALRTERRQPAHCLTPLAGPMSKARGSVRLIN